MHHFSFNSPRIPQIPASSSSSFVAFHPHRSTSLPPFLPPIHRILLGGSAAAPMGSAAAATVMKAGRLEVARPLPELPQELLEEIFVRLSPKCFIRCGGVCRAWHVVVSERAVKLLHHLRQPRQYHVITFVRQAGFRDLGVADFCLETLDVQDDKIRSIVRFVDTLPPGAAELGSPFVLHGSVQGVLLISHYENLFLCNPTTRHWARLRPIHMVSTMVGLYLHTALQEFRILYRCDDAVDGIYSYYVFEVVSREIRMVCQQKTTFQSDDPAPVCLNDRLYWFPVPILPGELTIFDTVDEVFDSMPVPPFDGKKQGMLGYQLLDLQGQLAISIAWREPAQVDLKGPSAVDLWVWDKDTWALKCRVQLPVPDILHFVADDIYWTAGLVSLDGDVIVTTKSRIIHYDHQGSSRLVLVLYNKGDYLELSPFVLKESVLPYPYLRLTNPPIPELPFFRWL